MQDVERDRLYTVGDVATLAGVSTQTIRRLEQSGVLPTAARSGPGGLRLWRGEHVNEVMQVLRDRRAARARAAA